MKGVFVLLSAALLVATQVEYVHGQSCFGFRCDNGACTSFNSDECDGFDDCSDGSDEENCPCNGFECDDGECTTFSSYECDGLRQCDDGSDEDDCVNVGLAVGLGIFFFVLFCIIGPIVLCVCIWCCVAGALGASFRNSGHTMTTVNTTPAMATVVTPVVATTTTTSTQEVKTDYPPPYTEAGGYPMQQYPTAPTQQPSYPAQQPGYPPQGVAYPAQQPGYPPQDAGYPAQQPGYPPQDAGYPAQQPGYPPQAGAYPPPQAAGYPPQ